MRKPRIRFSPIPLIILAFLLLSYPKLLPVLVLALPSLLSYFLGMFFLVVFIILLVYYKIGDIFGVLLVALALLFVESAYLDREKAPKEHYIILTVSVLLALPTYLFIRTLAVAMPRFEVTAIAMLILLTLYAFSKVVTD